MSSTLILTVTRRCDLRCSYCPTVKEGWPSLSPQDVRRAISLFVAQGGGDIKLFGGEPLLEPASVEAALEAAASAPEVRWLYLSTNGLSLDGRWLERLAAHPKAILTLSMDGHPDDHRRFRKAAEPGAADAYDHILSLLPRLTRVPRVVITQTIPPATAAHAARNFAHLRGLGFWRFNLLPGYYLPWKNVQLQALVRSFDVIADEITGAWQAGERLYLRNLFTWAPTPFFNTGMVVDADRSIHPSNVGLSGQLDGLRGDTCVGNLDAPPSPQALAAAAERIPALLQAALPPRVWRSTQAVDAVLSGLCDRLYPAYLRQRRARRRS